MKKSIEELRNIIDISYSESPYIFEGISRDKSSFTPSDIELILGYKPKTILEFGSNDGGDGLRYKLEYPNCNVYSIEASPSLFEKVKTVEKYGVKCFNYAITDYDGTIEFYKNWYKGKEGGGGSVLITTKETELTREEYGSISDKIPIIVPCITINSFCQQNNITEVDFIHIDVEGVSQEVIDGFGSIRPKCIFVELKAAYNAHIGATQVDKFEKTLFNMGYEFIIDNGNDCIYRLK